MKTYGKRTKRPLDNASSVADCDEKRVEISPLGAEKYEFKQLMLGMSLPKAKSTRPFMSPDAAKHMTNRVGAAGATAVQKSSPIQMYLDFGQKNFGERKTCASCGMVFCVGDEDDEKDHQRICGSLAGARFTCASRCIERGKHDAGVIVEIPRNANKRIIEQLNDVRTQVETQLGGPGGGRNDVQQPVVVYGDTESRSQDDAENPQNRPQIRTFLCVTAGNFVAGYLTVEPIRSDQVIVLPVEHEQKLADESKVVETSSDNTDEPLCTASGCSEDLGKDTASVLAGDGWHMGIQHIWVSTSWRRKGVATALIRAASAVFAVGGGCDIAFSQPTAQGTLLATAVLRNRTQISAYR